MSRNIAEHQTPDIWIAAALSHCSLHSFKSIHFPVTKPIAATVVRIVISHAIAQLGIGIEIDNFLSSLFENSPHFPRRQTGVGRKYQPCNSSDYWSGAGSTPKGICVVPRIVAGKPDSIGSKHPQTGQILRHLRRRGDKSGFWQPGSRRRVVAGGANRDAGAPIAVSCFVVEGSGSADGNYVWVNGKSCQPSSLTLHDVVGPAFLVNSTVDWAVGIPRRKQNNAASAAPPLGCCFGDDGTLPQGKGIVNCRRPPTARNDGGTFFDRPIKYFFDRIVIEKTRGTNGHQGASGGDADNACAVFFSNGDAGTTCAVVV